MKILMFRSTWGMDRHCWPELFRFWKALGYSGIELNLHRAGPNHAELIDLLAELDLQVIVQTFSSWVNYVGPRPPNLTVEDHLIAYEQNLIFALQYDPVLLNVQSGWYLCLAIRDYWTVDRSVEFYRGTLGIDEKLGLKGRVCHETHRNRAFFHPFITAQILDQVPEIRLTGDISHWIVVCERLLDTSPEDQQVLDRLIPHIHHIHARLGNTQSSQLPDPENGRYDRERAFFEQTWTKIVASIAESRARDWISVVAEYGQVGLSETLHVFQLRVSAYPYMPLGHSSSFSDLADKEAVRVHDILEKSILNEVFEK